MRYIIMFIICWLFSGNIANFIMTYTSLSYDIADLLGIMLVVIIVDVIANNRESYY